MKTQGPFRRIQGKSNLGVKLPGGRRWKRERASLGPGRGLDSSRHGQPWKSMQLQARVVFKEREDLQVPSPVGFRFWSVYDEGSVRHYAFSENSEKEVGRSVVRSLSNYTDRGLWGLYIQRLLG